MTGPRPGRPIGPRARPGVRSPGYWRGRDRREEPLLLDRDDEDRDDEDRDDEDRDAPEPDDETPRDGDDPDADGRDDEGREGLADPARDRDVELELGRLGARTLLPDRERDGAARSLRPLERGDELLTSPPRERALPVLERQLEGELSPRSRSKTEPRGLVRRSGSVRGVPELGVSVERDREEPTPGTRRSESERPLVSFEVPPGRGRLEPIPGALGREPERPVPASGVAVERGRLEPMPGMRRSGGALSVRVGSPKRGTARPRPTLDPSAVEFGARPRLEVPPAAPGPTGSVRTVPELPGRGRRKALAGTEVASASASPLRSGRSRPVSARRTDPSVFASATTRRLATSRRPRSSLRTTDHPSE